MPEENKTLYNLEEVGPVTIIHFTVDMLANLPLDRLYHDVEAHGSNRLVLDFSTVTMINSHSLVAFVSLRRKVLNQGGKIALYGLEPNLVELFERSRLRNFFPIFEHRDEALATVTG